MLKHRRTAGLGWKRDLPDLRDYEYAPPADLMAAALPSQVDLRPNCPPIYDQGDLGSCTANAAAGAFQYALMAQNLPDFMPSRLFIYWNERVVEGTTDYDSGAYIRDAAKVMAQLGVCSEDEWAYDINRFANQPPQRDFTDALQNRSLRYWRMRQLLSHMQARLASGHPFMFGFTVYSSIETEAVNRTGDIPMPSKSDSVLGGHAVLAVGYDEDRRVFLIRNSWGTSWGDAGYGTLPYDYLADPNLAADFWTIGLVS